MPRPIRATIHLSALTHNYQVARQCGGHAHVWAVVKANAYGHGLEFAMRAFAGADGLALVEVDGALKIRAAGWTKPVLLLEGFFHADDLPLVVQHQIDIVVHCAEQIGMIRAAAAAGVIGADRPVRVHLKLNGGMNRLGFRPEAVAEAAQQLSAIDGIRIVNLIMHFANADDEMNPRLPVSEQLRRFELAHASLAGFHLETSLSNSAANLLNRSIRNDWVRAGMMLYGGSPGQASAASFGLQPAMTLSSELIATQQLEVGETVGYGSRYVAQRPMRIGIVACGYADGYPRHARDGTPVLVNGIRTAMVGRVSMDMITVDITDIADAHVGSPVVLWGRGLPIDDVAQSADTIGYELMCAVAQRVPLVADADA